MINQFIILYNTNMDKQVSYKAIGERIRKAREAKSLTQTELGNKLADSMTATAISLYEKGERSVGVDVLSQIADILDVSFEYLAKGETENSPSIQVALRADKGLKDNDKAMRQIMDYIDLVKDRVDKKK